MHILQQFAAKVSETGKLNAEDYNISKTNLDSGTFSTMVGTAMWVAGAVAVIMIALSGLLYITAGGSPGKIATAKNLLMYTVLGIVVLIFAFTIVQFITGAFS